jgi:hypothetical protein
VSARLPVVRGALLVVCAFAFMALVAQPSQAEPKPETPPSSHGGKSPQPSPTPSAASTQSKSTATSVPASSSHVSTSTSTPSVSRVGVTTPITHNPVSSPSSSTAPTRGHTAPPKGHTAPLKHGLARLFELRVLAGLQELPSGAASRDSGLLLAAGFALVLLVIAETSFLGLARFRFGAGGVRTPSKRRPVRESVAIRRVQIRR